MTEDVILAEKPIAGNKIQDKLGIKTVPAIGHLLELKPKTRRWTPPYFDLQWTVRKKELDRLNKIVNLLKEADNIYIATDYDVEGQLIAYNILREAGIKPEATQRMKFSSLESDAIDTAFKNMIPFDENMALSAEVRHKLDWYFGMNISKAITELLKEKQGIRRYYLTPVGRVQTPILHRLVVKEKQINKFTAKDEWVVPVRGVHECKYFLIANYIFESEKDAMKFVVSLDTGVIDRVETFTYAIEIMPPTKDYVVKECLNQGVSVDVVDFILQDLYLDGYISYPRTISNQYKIHGVNTQKYLERLIDTIPLAKEALGKEPREGDEVGVHPAIYPIQPYVEKDLKGVVWNIITDAFIKLHLPPEVKDSISTYVNINGEIICASDNPNLEDDTEFEIVYQLKKRKSFPPDRFTPQKMYEWMVKHDLGTVDTRTQMLVKLSRTYVFQTNAGLYTSSKGIQVCDTLAKMYPDIIHISLTRRFEKLIKSVQNGAKIDPILSEGKETVKNIIGKIKEELERGTKDE